MNVSGFHFDVSVTDMAAYDFVEELQARRSTYPTDLPTYLATCLSTYPIHSFTYLSTYIQYKQLNRTHKQTEGSPPRPPLLHVDGRVPPACRRPPARVAGGCRARLPGVEGAAGQCAPLCLIDGWMKWMDVSFCTVECPSIHPPTHQQTHTNTHRSNSPPSAWAPPRTTKKPSASPPSSWRSG